MSVTTMAVRRTPTHAVTVSSVLDLTPRMRRITVTGPSLLGMSVAPAQDIELILLDPSGHRVKRRYTVRAARPTSGEFDIDALVHEHGPGGRWAAAAAPGDAVEFLGPRGHLEIRPAGWHLFLGDEAALPAIASLVQALPATEPAFVLAEVATPADEVPIEREAGHLDLRWLHRGVAPAGSPELLSAAVRELIPPTGPGQAYILAESRVAVALRPVVAGHGLSTEQMFVKGYWNVGRTGRVIPPA
jgi:NADPH-dependent ferric siderophore reductase